MSSVQSIVITSLSLRSENVDCVNLKKNEDVSFSMRLLHSENMKAGGWPLRIFTIPAPNFTHSY